MRVAVDTHALLWYLQGSSQISAPARLAIDGAIHIGGIVVSTGTLFDLTYLTEKGKLPYQAMRDVRDVIADVERPFSLAPANLLVLDHFGDPRMSQIRDPWDRLIVATAASQGLSLVTRDGQITASGLVRTIW